MNNQLIKLTCTRILSTLCLIFLVSCNSHSTETLKHTAIESVELLALNIAGQELAPAFDSNISSYTLFVEKDVETISINLIAPNGTKVTINTVAYTKTIGFALMDGDNIFDIQVANDVESRGYNLNIIRSVTVS